MWSDACTVESVRCGSVECQVKSLKCRVCSVSVECKV